jgi:hypothetical protein
MIGELHDELLPHHACGAKDANVYSAAGNHYVLHSESAERGRTKVLRYRRRACPAVAPKARRRAKKNPPAVKRRRVAESL